MTKVTMIYDNNLFMGFRMEGHAGYNTKGPDILCAALSTASQMTINGILDWSGLNVEDIIKEEDKAKAIMYVFIPCNLHVPTVVQQLLRSFEMYIEMLVEQYSDYVTLERRQRDDNESS